jgi:hypothetical protein
LLVLTEPHFDIANALKIFSQLVGIGLSQTLLHAPRVFQHRIEHAAFLSEHRLSFCERRLVVGEQSMKRNHRVVEPRERLASRIPSQ